MLISFLLVVVFVVVLTFECNADKLRYTVAYLGFQKGGGGETPRWWGAGEGSGEGPPPQKKIHFYVPKIIILGAF